MNIIKNVTLALAILAGTTITAEAQTKKPSAKPKTKTESKVDAPVKAAEAKPAPIVRQIPLAEKPITLGNGQNVVFDEVMSKPKNGFVLSKVMTDPATDCAQIFYSYKNADSTNTALMSAEITDEDKNGIITWAEAKNMFLHREFGDGEIVKDISAMTPETVTATGKGKLLKNLGNSLRTEFGGTTSYEAVSTFGQSMEEKTLRNDVNAASKRIYDRVFVPKNSF